MNQHQHYSQEQFSQDMVSSEAIYIGHVQNPAYEQAAPRQKTVGEMTADEFTVLLVKAVHIVNEENAKAEQKQKRQEALHPRHESMFGEQENALGSMLGTVGGALHSCIDIVEGLLRGTTDILTLNNATRNKDVQGL